MFGSITLEAAIGMAFVYLLLSLVCSAAREAIEARLKTRALHLSNGIVQLLGDPAAQRIYAHPLVQGLYRGAGDDPGGAAAATGDRAPLRAVTFDGHAWFSWVPALIASPWRRTCLPSYIPSRTFALALLSLARSGELFGAAPGTAKAGTATLATVLEPGAATNAPPAAPAASPATAPAPAPAPAGDPLLAAVRAALQAHGDHRLAAPLTQILESTGDDVRRCVDEIGHWYDGAMDRVSGWYKRETQHILFWLGMALAGVLNVDSIYLVKYLAADSTARSALIADAEKAREAAAPASGVVAGPSATVEDADRRVADAVHRVVDLNLPLGWDASTRHAFASLDKAHIAYTLLGWFMTAFAISFGAPFWFDALNRMMVVRSTVKPDEKSPKEPSKDA